MLFSLLIALAAAASPASRDSAIGTWSNPKGSVVVRTVICGQAICGSVIRASSEAKEKARAAGTANLVGTRILTGFRRIGAGRWQGEAFIPDLGLTAPATMVQLDRNSLEIEGCSLGGYLCKKQLWRRTSAAAGGRRQRD